MTSSVRIFSNMDQSHILKSNSAKYTSRTTSGYEARDTAPPVSSSISDEGEEERLQREHQNSSTHLLKLPPELRNRIYQYCTPLNTHVSVYLRLRYNQIAPLQVCRTLRNEMTPMFYACCTFHFDFSTRLGYHFANTWLEGLSISAVKSLRKLYFRSEGGFHPHSAFCWEGLNVWIDVTCDTRKSGVGCGLCHTELHHSCLRVRTIAEKIENACAEQAVK